MLMLKIVLSWEHYNFKNFHIRLFEIESESNFDSFSYSVEILREGGVPPRINTGIMHPYTFLF